MIYKIDPHSPTPIYAQVVELFKNLILSGGISAGESLPSVRQLAGQLEVNSLTIQKAYKQLEAIELIVIKKGVGAFVNQEIKELNADQKLHHIKSGLRPV
jgi:GntR family transcriptional regulator